MHQARPVSAPVPFDRRRPHSSSRCTRNELDRLRFPGGEVKAPGVVSRLVSWSRQKHNPIPKNWEQFVQEVSVNNKRLEDFPFLRLTTQFDSSNIGPIRTAAPHRLSPIEFMFVFYAARQDVASTGQNADPTFEDIERANSTLSVAEFLKLCSDLVPFKFHRGDLLNIFQLTSQERRGACSLDGDSELEFGDFCRLFVRLALITFNDDPEGTPRDALVKFCKLLQLDDMPTMRKNIERIGRVNAGFGAWRMPDDDKQTSGEAALIPRIIRGDDLERYMVSNQKLNDLCITLTEFGGVQTVIDWCSCSGPYVAVAVPQVKSRRRYRFRISLQNISSARGFPICHRVQGLPFVSVKFLPPRPLAAGMDIRYELFVESPLPPGEHVGAFIFSAVENGPELFRCPIYIRQMASHVVTVEDKLRQTIQKHCKTGSLEASFRTFDTNNDGLISRREFRMGIQNAGLNISEEMVQALLFRVDTNRDGKIQYREFVQQLGPSQAPSSLKSVSSGKSAGKKVAPLTSTGSSSALLQQRQHMAAPKQKNDGVIDPAMNELLGKGRGASLTVREATSVADDEEGGDVLPLLEQRRPQTSMGIPRSVAVF